MTPRSGGVRETVCVHRRLAVRHVSKVGRGVAARAPCTALAAAHSIPRADGPTGVLVKRLPLAVGPSDLLQLLPQFTLLSLTCVMGRWSLRHSLMPPTQL